MASAVVVETVKHASAISKPAYFIKHREAARAVHDKKDEVLGDGNELLHELKTLFDWMAKETDIHDNRDRIIRTAKDKTRRIPLRHFKRRLPEIHRKFPILANSFKRMDTDNNCWLDYDEFVNYCLKDERLLAQMRRSTVVQVYGLDVDGTKSYKEDALHTCEMGMPTPLLLWETAHVVEWRIEGLCLSRKGSPTTYAGMEVRAGTSIASPPFRAAGVCGFLRFWPSGYWTESMRRRKASAPPGMEEFASGGHCSLPSHLSWCCLGVCMPVGTHLALRFFVANDKSERKECYWCTGTNSSQLWAPSAKEPPASMMTADHMIVGVEILRNLGSTDCRPHAEIMNPAKRLRRRHNIAEFNVVHAMPKFKS